VNNFAIDELTKKDFFTSLSMWIALEMLCFLFLPRVGFIQSGPHLRPWLVTSIPLGIGGAIVSAFSSRFLAIANEQDATTGRDTKILVGQLMGGVGLAGILFPIAVAAIEFIAKLRSQYP
jgi:hypothetical protein